MTGLWRPSALFGMSIWIVLSLPGPAPAAPNTLPQASPAAPRAFGTPARTIAELDQHVLQAILDDLLIYTGEDSPFTVRRSAPKELLFATRFLKHARTAEDLLEPWPGYKEAWAKLTPAETTAARESAKHAVRRIASGDLFVQFAPHDARIRLTSGDAHQQATDDPGARWIRPIRTLPPGYSRDHKTAIVQLLIPMGNHAAEATYLLRSEDGKWIVRLRQFSYFI